MNQVTFVGRIANEIETIEKEGEKGVNVIVAINRPFRNKEGIYETDLIPTVICEKLAENLSNSKKGDLIGIKGHLERIGNEELKVVAERVMVLAKTNTD